MATGSHAFVGGGNLSTLSRGLGAVTRNGHERIDIFLEPQDNAFRRHDQRLHRKIADHKKRTRICQSPPYPDNGSQNYTTAIARARVRNVSPVSSDGYHSAPDEDNHPRRSSRDQVSIHKTYTTRRGALLLFSEQLADRLANKYRLVDRQPYEGHDRINKYGRRRLLHPVHGGVDGRLRRDDDVDQFSSEPETGNLQRVDELAWAVLNYGSKASDGVCLNIVKYPPMAGTRHVINSSSMAGPTVSESRVRPGFSAKRYLSRLTRSFDDNFLQKMIANGYVQEKSLYTANELMPNLKRRINDDLSESPTPYRLLKRMLVAPGLLSGFTFFIDEPTNGKKQKQTTTKNRHQLDSSSVSESSSTKGMGLHGRVMKVGVREVRNGIPVSLSYSSLSTDNKEKALADLLVKSALGQALDQRQSDEDESIMEVTSFNKSRGDQHESLTRSNLATVGQLDMIEAVQSYLNSQSLAEYDINDNDDDVANKAAAATDDEQSDVSSRHSRQTLSRERVNKRHHRGGVSSSTGGLEITGTAASVAQAAGAGTTPAQGSATAKEIVAQQFHRMTPIADVSREVTSFGQWPVIPDILRLDDKPENDLVEPSSEEDDGEVPPMGNNFTSTSVHGDVKKPQNVVSRLPGAVTLGIGLPTVKFGDVSTDAAAPRSLHNTKPSRKLPKPSGGAAEKSRRNYDGLTVPTGVTGSVLVLPGGEVMQIGQTVVPSTRTMPAANAHGEIPAGQLTIEQQLITTLSERAREIASMVLSKPGAGVHLANDAMSIAKTLANGDVNELAELTIYQDMIRETLSSVVSQLSGAGDSGLAIEKASISPELLEALLVQQTIDPRNICVSVDTQSGKPIITLQQDVGGNQTNRIRNLHKLPHDKSKVGGCYRADQSDADPNRDKVASKKPRIIDRENVPTGATAESVKDKPSGAGGKKRVERNDVKDVKRVEADDHLRLDTDPTTMMDKMQLLEENMQTQISSSKDDNRSELIKELNSSVELDVVEADGRNLHVVSDRFEDDSNKDGDQSDRSEDVHDSEEEMDFVIVRDEFPDDEEVENRSTKNSSKTSSKSPLAAVISSSNNDGSESDSNGIKSSSTSRNETREMRAAQREARAIKRREETERKRREREEQLRQERAENVRREELIRELEMERAVKEAERRAERERLADERRKQEEEEEAKERKRRADAEREIRQREEFARKLEELRKKQAEEDKRRRELEEQRRREEEEARIREEQLLAQMEEAERIEYLRKKKEEEELARQKMEEEKKRREEEQRIAMEEAMKLAQEMAREQEALRRRLEFNRSLNEEAQGLDRMHEISRAFVYSYLELIQFLGHNIAQNGPTSGSV